MITELFSKPKIIGIAADANTGKSNLIYHILHTLNEKYSVKIYAYGLKSGVERVHPIHSVTELELIRDSVIVIDEMFSLFDLDNRKVKNLIENTIRLIYHHNNVLLLCGVPENFKKFLSGKLNVIFFKKVTIADLINGSSIKNTLMNYKGNERGSSVLNMPVDEALVYDGLHYTVFKVPYLKQYDLKANNVPILNKKGNVRKSVPKIVEKEKSAENVEENQLVVVMG